MNWKLIGIIVGIYLVIFVGIFYYSNKATANSKNESLSWDFIKNSVASIFGKVYTNTSQSKLLTDVKEASYINLSIAKYISGKTCNIESPFKCDTDFFVFNQSQKSIFLSFKYTGTKKVIISDIKVSGGVNCEYVGETTIESGKNFYVKLENCEFDDIVALISISYRDIESAQGFERTSEGNLIFKE